MSSTSFYSARELRYKEKFCRECRTRLIREVNECGCVTASCPNWRQNWNEDRFYEHNMSDFIHLSRTCRMKHYH
jgi:hypothetical protein